MNSFPSENVSSTDNRPGNSFKQWSWSGSDDSDFSEDSWSDSREYESTPSRLIQNHQSSFSFERKRKQAMDTFAPELNRSIYSKQVDVPARPVASKPPSEHLQDMTTRFTSAKDLPPLPREVPSQPKSFFNEPAKNAAYDQSKQSDSIENIFCRKADDNFDIVIPYNTVVSNLQKEKNNMSQSHDEKVASLQQQLAKYKTINVELQQNCKTLKDHLCGLEARMENLSLNLHFDLIQLKITTELLEGGVKKTHEFLCDLEKQKRPVTEGNSSVGKVFDRLPEKSDKQKGLKDSELLLPELMDFSKKYNSGMR